MIMKRLLTIVAVAAVFAACKEPRSWCPTEVSVPFVSADIPDTAKVEKSVKLSLGDSARYVAIYDILIGNEQTMSVVSASKIIVVRK